MNTCLTVTFYNITEDDRDRIIEYCNQSDHDYDGNIKRSNSYRS